VPAHLLPGDHVPRFYGSDLRGSILPSDSCTWILRQLVQNKTLMICHPRQKPLPRLNHPRSTAPKSAAHNHYSLSSAKNLSTRQAQHPPNDSARQVTTCLFKQVSNLTKRQDNQSQRIHQKHTRNKLVSGHNKQTELSIAQIHNSADEPISRQYSTTQTKKQAPARPTQGQKQGI